MKYVQSLEYVCILNLRIFLLPFSWISVQGFLDFTREESIYGAYGYVITCTILFFTGTYHIWRTLFFLTSVAEP
jgi:hypothetical protein